MLDISTEIVCDIIAKARAFHAKEGVVFPHEVAADLDDDWAMQVLADHADDPTYIDVSTAVQDLEPAQQVNLVALMWVGRGDLDWEEALGEARARWTPRTAEYLLGTPLVATYLEEGLSQMGFSCDEE